MPHRGAMIATIPFDLLTSIPMDDKANTQLTRGQLDGVQVNSFRGLAVTAN
jgi:hypothetical protein